MCTDWLQAAAFAEISGGKSSRDSGNDVSRMNQVLRAVPGCVPNVGFLDAERDLSFDLVSLYPGQSQEVLEVSGYCPGRGIAYIEDLL